MIKAVFFDLDGTLVPMNEKEFLRLYIDALTIKAAKLGYESEKLIEVITNSIPMMINNTSSLTNEQVFWKYFCSVYGQDKIADRYVLFSDFYKNEFKQVKPSLGDNPYATKIIEFCKDHFEYVILTTQPVFPKDAAIYRLSTVGLKESDFTYITSYEDSVNGKPNASYFKRVLDLFDLKSDEVVLIGNNTLEDAYAAEQCGIKTYLIEEGLITNPGIDDHYQHIHLVDVVETLKSLI